MGFCRGLLLHIFLHVLSFSSIQVELVRLPAVRFPASCPGIRFVGNASDVVRVCRVR
jgi:hypothetical protein